VDRVLTLFPSLAQRARSAGSQLSGGEQQMLAIGRALMTNPSLLILDEATEGLAPLVRVSIWQAIAALKAQGQSILLIDKNLEALLRIADRHYVMEKGQIVWQGDSAALAADQQLKDRYLGV
jgi:branched-chain amino acid transport system ATP-binding protein